MKKNNKNYNYKIFLGIIFGILFSNIAVYASSNYLGLGKNLIYSNSNSSIVSSNIQWALDELYKTKTTGCPLDKICLDISNNIIAKNFMIPNAQSDSSIDFSKTSASTNTNGVYLRSGTENDNYPIYYYRGNVNNNLIFAGFCWKIVRTTETGGLKIIYNGTPTDNTCDNTNTNSVIGSSKFGVDTDSIAYMGYMYGAVYEHSYKRIDNTDSYVYGNSVTYSSGTYTLNDTISDTWANLKTGGLNNNHYTCFTTGTTCSSVYYIYYANNTTAYIITISGREVINSPLSDMLDNNLNSSTIKQKIDTWYSNNIEQNGYSNYIEDTIWCNDRSISDYAGWNPNGGMLIQCIYILEQAIEYQMPHQV